MESRFDGHITDEMLRAYARALVGDPRYRAEYAHLIDGSEITQLDVHAPAVEGMVQTLPRRTPAAGPRVIVAPTPVSYGLARMFQIRWADDDPAAVQIVATRAEAEALLGLSS